MARSAHQPKLLLKLWRPLQLVPSSVFVFCFAHQPRMENFTGINQMLACNPLLSWHSQRHALCMASYRG